MKIRSFSYRDSGWPTEPGWALIDCRSLPNPHNDQILRKLDGRDLKVRKFLVANASPRLFDLMATATHAMDVGLNVAFGCFGGRHRSVCLAEMLAEEASRRGLDYTVEHTALEG